MPTYALPPNSSFWNNVAPLAYELKSQLTTSPFEKALSLDLVSLRIKNNYSLPSTITNRNVGKLFKGELDFGIKSIDVPVYPIW